ncbi:MAG: hypothetical protein QM765_47640 [Myxococcales bacterium]
MSANIRVASALTASMELQVLVEPGGFGFDLLLEHGLEDHRAGAGLLELLELLGRVAQRGAGDDERVAQLEAEVGGGEAGHRDVPLFGIA